MAKIVGIVCSSAVLLLLSGCAEQLASEAQKVADQIAAEATKTAAHKLDELKSNTLEQLRLMRGEGSNGNSGVKSATKPDEAANTKTTPKSDW